MHGDPGPGQSLHVGHLGTFVDAGLMLDFSLQNGEDSSGSFLAGPAGADGGAGNLDAVSINIRHLIVDADHHQHRTPGGSFGIPLKLAGSQLALIAGSAAGVDQQARDEAEGEAEDFPIFLIMACVRFVAKGRPE